MTSSSVSRKGPCVAAVRARAGPPAPPAARDSRSSMLDFQHGPSQADSNNEAGAAAGATARSGRSVGGRTRTRWRRGGVTILSCFPARG